MPETILRLRIAVAVLGILAGLPTAAFAYEYAVDQRLSRIVVDNRTPSRATLLVDGVSAQNADPDARTEVAVDAPTSLAVEVGAFQLILDVPDEMKFRRLRLAIEDAEENRSN
jgi:hypothetical protein